MNGRRHVRVDEYGVSAVSATPARVLNVLAVLERDDGDVTSTVAVAVALAERDGARLTFAKTTAINWHVGCAALWPGGLTVPPEPQDLAASRALARAAKQVPPWIPLTTLVLGPRPRRALLDLVGAGRFDAVVARERLLRQSGVRRELKRLGVRIVEGNAVPRTGVSTVEGDAVPQSVRGDRPRVRPGRWRSAPGAGPLLGAVRVPGE